MTLSPRSKDLFAGYAFVLPAFLFLAVFLGFPIVYNVALGFQHADAMNLKAPVKEFIGLNNFQELWDSGILGTALVNTVAFTLGSLIIQFIGGLVLALFFDLSFPGSQRLRGLMVVSWMIPTVATALLFKFMLSPSSGVLNDLLVGLRLSAQPVAWLSNPATAMFGVILANSWVGISFNMILLATGLTTIPREVYESARMDGAGAVRQFFQLTVPLLKPTMLAILLLGFIYTFKVFDLIFVMTNGGPVNATEVLSTYSYRLSFSVYQFGQGAAAADVLFLCLVLVAVGYLRLIRTEEVQ
jgi:multiple sugar transport system permease protein